MAKMNFIGCFVIMVICINLIEVECGIFDFFSHDCCGKRQPSTDRDIQICLGPKFGLSKEVIRTPGKYCCGIGDCNMFCCNCDKGCEIY